MTDEGGLLPRSCLRAPGRHGQTLIHPPLETAGEWIRRNQAAREAAEYVLHGMSWRRLVAEARRRLTATARRYTAAYCDPPEPAATGPDAPILVVGHQPELYHPGVWFKNFVLDRLAREHQAWAIHVLCDNDAAKPPAVAAPAPAPDGARRVAIPLDRAGPPAPYEQRLIMDGQLFASFGRRAAEVVRPLVPEPLVLSLWPRAVQAAHRGARLGQAIAEARHAVERQAGLATLETPLSLLCDQDPFRWLAAHLLARAEEVLQTHNEALAEYRRAYKVRSRSHPAPELERDGPWCEAPFWVWTRDDPRRRRLFVRRVGRDLQLTDRAAWCDRWRLPADGDAAAAVAQWGDAAAGGLKIRPRALVTTLWLRLLCADLFLHGLGGARYDQLTDVLIARLFGFRPPAFLTITATFRLTGRDGEADPQDLARIDQLLRQLQHHPERHARDCEPVRRLAEEKWRWIAQRPPRGQGRRRREAIRQINAALQPYVEDQRRALLEERRRLAKALRDERVLTARDYAFCLFPETLPSQLQTLAAQRQAAPSA